MTTERQLKKSMDIIEENKPLFTPGRAVLLEIDRDQAIVGLVERASDIGVVLTQPWIGRLEFSSQKILPIRLSNLQKMPESLWVPFCNCRYIRIWDKPLPEIDETGNAKALDLKNHD